MKTTTVMLTICAALHSAAWGHDWYPKECCNDKDCRPLVPGSVTLETDGWHLTNGEVVPLGMEQRHDGDDFHACFYPVADPTSGESEEKLRWLYNGTTRNRACFYVPGAQG